VQGVHDRHADSPTGRGLGDDTRAVYRRSFFHFVTIGRNTRGCSGIREPRTQGRQSAERLRPFHFIQTKAPVPGIIIPRLFRRRRRRSACDREDAMQMSNCDLEAGAVRARIGIRIDRSGTREEGIRRRYGIAGSLFP
jgi:hypothetical protein